jgi:capsule polysaccharide export protein KpsE/RkpR
MAHDPVDISVKDLENGRLLSEGESSMLPDADQPLITPMETAWLLWENRRRVFRVCLTGLIIFTLIAFTIPKKYKSTARLMPPDFNTSTLMSLALPVLGSQGSTGGGMGGGSVMGLASQLLGMNSSGNLFIGVLRSRTIEDEIIRQFDLQKLYSKRYIEDTRTELEGNTDIQIDKKSGILSISVEDKSPDRARSMAQAYVQELGKVLTAENSSAAHRERMFIENRLAEVKDDLDKSSKEFSQFSSQNSTINLPEQAKAMVGAAAQMQGQFITAQAELRGLEQIYTDNNIRVRQAKARVAELQDQINKFAGKGVDPSRDTSLAAGELYPSMRQLPLLGVKYLDLYRQSKIDETVYELLTKQYEVAKIQEARENPTVQVLDRPVVPEKKSFPHRLWIMLAGLLLSFLAVTAWILGDFAWQRIDPKDPRRVFGASVFAQVKAILWDSRWFRGLRRKFTRNSSDALPERP